MAALGDEDVCGLDVAVNNAFGVGRVEGVGDFDGQLEQSVGVERAPSDGVLEGQAVQKLHGNKGLAVVLVNFINRADIGMVQGGCRLSFALETGQGLGIFGYFVGQEFQGYEAAKLDVFGFVDDAHAATTELFNHSIVRDSLADHWR